jgi:hypothetical protein
VIRQRDGVAVGVGLSVGLGVGLGDAVGVAVGVGDGVGVGDSVGVGVAVTVGVGVAVGLGVVVALPPVPSTNKSTFATAVPSGAARSIVFVPARRSAADSGMTVLCHAQPLFGPGCVQVCHAPPLTRYCTGTSGHRLRASQARLAPAVSTFVNEKARDVPESQ